MNREEILILFKKMRSSCPNTNSICSSMSLRKIGAGGEATKDEFDLHLKWVPDEPSRTFLKDYALKHNLGLTETQNSVTIKSSGYDARNIF